MITLPKECLRGRDDCEPLSQVKSDDKTSFICCGMNDGTERTVEQDCFTMCWKNQDIDTRDFWDKRDITDTISVMAQALSIDANIENNEGETDITIEP